MGLKYNIYLDGKFVKETTSLSTIVDGLEVETEYSVSVSETDGEKESKKTNPIKFKTLPNPNLLPNTDFKDGYGDWIPYPIANIFEILNAEEDKPNSKIMHAKASSQTNQQCFLKPHDIPVKQGEEYTFSFDYKDVNWTKNIIIAQVRITATAADNTALETFSLSSTSGNSDWERKVFNFVVTKDGFLSFNFFDSDNTGSHEGFYRQAKVEKGNKATSWIPAESDLI